MPPREAISASSAPEGRIRGEAFERRLVLLILSFAKAPWTEAVHAFRASCEAGEITPAEAKYLISQVVQERSIEGYRFTAEYAAARPRLDALAQGGGFTSDEAFEKFWASGAERTSDHYALYNQGSSIESQVLRAIRIRLLREAGEIDLARMLATNVVTYEEAVSAGSSIEHSPDVLWLDENSRGVTGLALPLGGQL